ncbi:MAG: glycerol kinase GlpK [Candidatus Cloacimonetes bacterium]|nr:glycerol kinase GlpK [Candidatus Cloacimonadota bacterium]
MGQIKKKYFLAFDQGTSSSRTVLFTEDFQVAGNEQLETKTVYPQPGWVEQDALTIWKNQLLTAQNLFRRQAIDPARIAALGITNQRETTIVWDKTGKPVYPAIIWQDKRTAPLCRKMQKDGLAEHITKTTGLVINPYFSATKLAWILDNVPGARTKAEQDKLFFGTIDTWLLWNLSGGKLHITDYSNASRTMLFDINNLRWDETLLKYLHIPANMLPAVHSSSEIYGETSLLGGSIPLAGIAGDQQAALFGQQCREKGMAKNTYGTGCFLLMNTGETPVHSKSGLLTTIAWGIDHKITYALEGSVFMGGALIKWLRDELQIISTAAESEDIALSLPDNEGVYFVPAFNGLGAPYWDTEASGTICGIRSGCGRAHIVRAALEALAFQTRDVLVAMEKDAMLSLKELRVDGGAAANNFLMQFQSDILGCRVRRPEILESTALGAAMLAAQGVGLLDNNKMKNIKIDKEFKPQISTENRIKYCQGWKKAVTKARLSD